MAVDRIRVVWVPPSGADSIEFSDDPDASHFLLEMTGFLSNRVEPVYVQSPGQRGTSLTNAIVDARVLTITAWLGADTPEELWDAREDTASAFVVEPSDDLIPAAGILRVFRSGRATREIDAIPRDSPQDEWVAETTVSLDIEFYAPYPYWRGMDDESLVLVPSGGLEFPLEFPLESASSAVSGVALNSGTVSTPVVIRIDGPVDTPRIENVTTGKVLEIDTNLAEDEWIIIATAHGAKTITHFPSGDNLLSFVNLDSTDFWTLAKGPNEIVLTGVTIDAANGAGATVTWRSQWAGI